MWSWLLHITGVDDPSGRWATWWGGFGGDLSELAVLGALVGVWRHHNCHVRWCWRLQRHVAGDYVVCRKHHPTIPSRAPSADQIR